MASSGLRKQRKLPLILRFDGYIICSDEHCEKRKAECKGEARRRQLKGGHSECADGKKATLRESPTIRPLTGFDHLAAAPHICAHISLKCSTIINNKVILAAIADLNS